VPPVNNPAPDPGAQNEVPPEGGNQAPAIGPDVAPPSGWKKPFSGGALWNDASPFVEAALNLAWEVPVAFSYIDAKSQPNFDYKANVLE